MDLHSDLILSSLQLVECRVAAVKRLPVHHHSADHIFSGPLGPLGSVCVSLKIEYRCYRAWTVLQHYITAHEHLNKTELFTWLSLVVSLMASFCAVLFPTRCLGRDLGLNWVSFRGFSYLLCYFRFFDGFLASNGSSFRTYFMRPVLTARNYDLGT